jgi:hypothetical protein
MNCVTLSSPVAPPVRCKRSIAVSRPGGSAAKAIVARMGTSCRQALCASLGDCSISSVGSWQSPCINQVMHSKRLRRLEALLLDRRPACTALQQCRDYWTARMDVFVNGTELEEKLPTEFLDVLIVGAAANSCGGTSRPGYRARSMLRPIARLARAVSDRVHSSNLCAKFRKKLERKTRLPPPLHRT